MVVGELVNRALDHQHRAARIWGSNASAFRVDGDGVHEVDWRVDNDEVIVSDARSRDGIYAAAQTVGHREAIETRRQNALAVEANHEVDQASLSELLR